MSGVTTLGLNSVGPGLLGRSSIVLCTSGVKNPITTPRSYFTHSCRNVWMEKHERRLVPSVSITENAALPDGAAGWIVSGAGIGAIGVLILKFIGYSQLEVVRTKMLGRYVARNESRVLQLGGTTRDLYYYPKGVVQVIVNVPDAPISLYEQAGIQSGIPVSVNCENTVDFLSSQKRNMFDCVVCFDQFDNSMTESQIKTIINSIYRVLKPGGSYIFYQRCKEGKSLFGGLAQSLGGKPTLDRDIGNLITFCNMWDFCEWDIASPSFDPHQVGVCIKSKDENNDQNQEEASKNSSVDSTTFEQIMKRGKRNSKKS